MLIRTFYLSSFPCSKLIHSEHFDVTGRRFDRPVSLAFAFFPPWHALLHLIECTVPSYSTGDLSYSTLSSLLSRNVKRSRPLIKRPFKKRIGRNAPRRSITRLVDRSILVYTGGEQEGVCAPKKGSRWIVMFFINCSTPSVVCRSKDKVKQGCNWLGVATRVGR